MIILPVVPTQIKLSKPELREVPSEISFTSPMSTDPSTKPRWNIIRDLVNDSFNVELEFGGEIEIDDRKLITNATMKTKTTMESPELTVMETTYDVILEDKIIKTNVKTRGELRSDLKNFYATVGVDIDINDRPYFNKKWFKTVPRKYL